MIKHFCTITRHRLLVCKHCFKLGLYWQGLTHDLSKYSPEEFWTGVRYYQGDRSPNAAEREVIGFSKAWLHHKGRNKHHFEYWIDVSLNKEEGLVGNKMPVRYVAEMAVHLDGFTVIDHFLDIFLSNTDQRSLNTALIAVTCKLSRKFFIDLQS